MTTRTTIATAAQVADRVSGSTPAQRVIVVDGDAGTMDLLEKVLGAGRYDVVFIESHALAYSQIKRVLPNLVIVCIRIEAIEGFHLLSMLKIDEETRDIPLLTYTAAYEGQDADDVWEEPSESELLVPAAAPRMH